jgi:hypothetical protein
MGKKEKRALLCKSVSHESLACKNDEDLLHGELEFICMQR